MGGYARAVTDSAGRFSIYHDLKIGEGGHGTSSDKYMEVEFPMGVKIILSDLYDKSLRFHKLYEALVEIGVHNGDDLILSSKTKEIKRTRLKKDGTPMAAGRTRSSHYAVDVMIRNKNIRVMIGNDTVKIGIKSGANYQFFRSAGHVNKLINSKG